MLVVGNGFIEMLESFNVPQLHKSTEFTEEEIESFLNDIKKDLPFSPYDFQEKAFKESLLVGKQINKMCTGSGKSMTISLIAEFFRRKNRKGLLLVPNINLLTQFKADILSYNLKDLYKDTHIIGGGGTVKHFNNSLTISTWQSLQERDDLDLEDFDYVITDEAHRFASEETSAIVKETTKCKYKWGFTGTLPEDPVAKMELVGLFGFPRTYITSSELIARGLATPININSIFLNYNSVDTKIFQGIKASGRSKNKYPNQLSFIEEHEERSKFVTDLTCKVYKSGNTLVLGSHVDHLKSMYLDIMKKLYPEVTNIKNKQITGKKSFEFQEQYGVYYISGSDDAKTRELTRKILEEKLYKITFNDGKIVRLHGNKELDGVIVNDITSEDKLKLGVKSIEKQNQILVSGYKLLSTGVNIKALHNMILASPMKSYNTITQSIGRLMRLHPEKSVANIFDLIDNTGIRKVSGIFVKQYQHRCKTSYYPEEFPIKEVHYNL